MRTAATEKKPTEQLEEAGKASEERVGHRRCPEGRVWGQLKAKGGTLRSQEWDGSGRGRGDQTVRRENGAEEPERSRM